MKKTVLTAFFLALAFTALGSSSYIKITDPVFAQINSGAAASDSISLGVAGPGQTLELTAGTDTGEQSANLSTEGKIANWNVLRIIPSSLPSGWMNEDSQEFSSPMKARVIIPKNAADGEYSFTVQAVDNYEGVAPLSFKAKAIVSKDVFDFRLSSDPVKVAVGQKAVYSFELFNKGSASDVFELSTIGLPEQYSVKKTVFVPKASKATESIELSFREPKEYPVTFSAVSLSGPAINGVQKATLFVGSDFVSEAKAAGRGVLLFPSAENALYSIISFLANLLF
ncbi:hypothetical protein HY993_01560 [Candidatus Micrarchaeota archaeon]|nr:hypothetical protein [Candidatus Micrarchaeota archaeon]